MNWELMIIISNNNLVCYSIKNYTKSNMHEGYFESVFFQIPTKSQKVPEKIVFVFKASPTIFLIIYAQN